MEINPETLEIEIVSIEPIDGGVQVLARAWSDGVQIGFGSDGTVDIERFKIINPQIFVPDEYGDIIATATDEVTGETVTSSYREDPEQALLIDLASTLQAKKEIFDDNAIVVGKIGSTTTTVNYNSTNSKQCCQDGVATYAGAHDATTSTVYSLPAATNNILHNSKATTYYVRRGDLQFDTSSIPDSDTITSATLRMRAVATGSANADTDTVVALDNTNNANLDTTLASEDMDDFTTTSIGSQTLASYTGVNTDVDLTFSSYSFINKTGTSRVGLRLQKDIDNTSPTGNNILRVATGTTCQLIIEHAGATATFTPRVMVY